MSKCVNINSPEFKSLVEQTGSDPLILSAMMGNWMELNNTDEWPTLEQLGIGIIKPGVEELFESTPELASIGTQEQYSQYLDTIFPDSQVKDIVYHGTIFDFPKFSKKKLGRYTQAPSASQGFFFTNNRLVSDSYIKPERIKEQEWIYNQNKEFVERYGKLTDISRVDNAIKELKELLEFQNNNTYNLKPNTPEYYSDSEYIIFKDSKDAKFNSYREEVGWKELEPQKTYRRFYDYRSNSYNFEEVSGERLKLFVDRLYKSPTKKDYKFNKKYLEHSLSWMEYIKDLYEQGEDLPNLPIKFEWEIAENESYGNRELLNTYIINKYAEIGKTSYRKPSPITKNVILNLENPLIFDYEGEKYRSISYYDKLKEASNKGNDGAVLQNTYDSGFLKEDKYEADVFVVFEPEQIHVLGGKNDVEGFKEFVGDKNIFLRTELPGRERLLGNEFLEESDTYLKSTSGKYRNQNQDVKEKYFFDGNVQTIDTILDRIINSGNPLSKLASQIKKAASITGVEVEFVSNDFEVEGADNNKWTGIYVKDKKKIYIKGKAYTSSEALLMHEIIHAVSVEYIKNNSEDPLVKELKSLYEYAKKNINTEEYGFTDEYEFIAELFTNSSFASKLMDIKATKPSKYSNLFEEFWDTIIKIILKFYGKAIKGDTLYEQAFAIGTHIIENQYEQTLFMKDLMDMSGLENSYKESNFYFEKDAPINKNSILYKKLIKAFPKRHADTMYRELTSPSFMEWYGNGVKDEEGNPRVTSQFVVSKMYLEGKFNLFSDVKFETKEEVEKFLLALDSAGISKFKGSYYISKNNRENALNWIKRIETTHPGLLKLYPAKTQEGVLGKSDQSMHIVRIGINEDYFGNGQLFPFIQTKQEDPIKNSDPRDYIIRRLEEYNIRIHNLVRDAKKEKKQDLVNKYEELFKNNVESIKILKEERNIASILKRAQSDLSYVKSVLSQKEVDSNDLIEIGRLIDLYTNIAEVGSKSALITVEDLKPRAVVKINEQGEEIIEQDITALTKSIQEIGGQFKSQSQLYDDILKKIATREFNAAFDQDIQEEKLFEATEDLGFIDKTRGVMSMRSRLLNLLGMIRTAALQKAEAETLRDEKVREKMNESLKGSSLFNRLGRIKFMDLFWQKDEKGQITGGLINKYSNKYWDFIRSYGEGLKSDKKNVRNAAKKRHYNNHEYVNYFETEEERQAEIDRLNSIIENITLVEEIVSDAEEKFIEYRERRDQRFDNIEGSDLTKERKEFEKDKWIKENNPSETIKNLKEGTESSNPEGGVYFNSFEFVRSIPLKVDRTGKKTEWYDSAFEQIQSDPIAYEYYNYVRKKIKELISFYPQSYLDSKSIHKGFIPQIKNSLMKEFKQQGIIGSLKGARSLSTELIKKWTTIKTFSKATDHVDPGTGSPINTLGIAMLSPKFNTIENGKLIESNDIVKDLDEILASFIPVTNIYKHKARVEATYNLVAESAGLLKGIKTNKSGSWLRNKATDEIYTDPANLNNLEELVQFEVDTFYGVQQSKHEKGSKKKTLNKVEKEELEKINKRLEEISDKLSNREELTEEEEKNLEKEQLDLSVKRDDMGASFSGTKSLKSWLKWYQLLSQGWNLHSPVIELIYGFMTNYTHASGGRDYSNSQIRRAYSIAMTAVTMSGKSSESRKFNNIIEKFNIIGEVFENDGDGTNSRNRISAKNLIKPYHFMKNMDKITKGSAAVAVMMNTTIESIDGKKSNLYDALDENGELKPEFQTEENISKWTINTESTEINDIQRLRAKINEINIRNTGNYDPNQPIPVNSKAAGQAILQFRRWLLEGFAQRFEKERESDTLGRKIKGRYITYRDLGIKNSASIILKMLLKKATFQKISDEDLIEMGVEDEVDIENMRKNATGVIMTIMLTMGMLILSKMFDDDDEKDFSLLNFTLNMGGRLQQDLWFYSNPGTANDFLGNIVPSARLYDKITGWMEASFKQIFTDYDQDWSTEYERGELKGWNKMTIKTGELIPGSSAAIKAYRLGTKIIE